MIPQLILWGSKFGKHKTFFQKFPQKTWEKAFYWGWNRGIVLLSLFGNLQSILFVGFDPRYKAIMGFCAYGKDLFESSLKRKFGVKDSGIFPGHGDFMIDLMHLSLYCLCCTFAFYSDGLIYIAKWGYTGGFFKLFCLWFYFGQRLYW